jgi:uncharacterized membrane protein
VGDVIGLCYIYMLYMNIFIDEKLGYKISVCGVEWSGSTWLAVQCCWVFRCIVCV